MSRLVVHRECDHGLNENGRCIRWADQKIPCDPPSNIVVDLDAIPPAAVEAAAKGMHQAWKDDQGYSDEEAWASWEIGMNPTDKAFMMVQAEAAILSFIDALASSQGLGSDG